jgi:hypothetical protein
MKVSSNWDFIWIFYGVQFNGYMFSFSKTILVAFKYNASSELSCRTDFTDLPWPSNLTLAELQKF